MGGLSEARPELLANCRPADRRRLRQRVPAARQPAIDVERHGVVVKLPDGAFLNRDRVLGKLLEKTLRQSRDVEEEANLRLVASFLDEHRRGGYVLVN